MCGMEAVVAMSHFAVFVPGNSHRTAPTGWAERIGNVLRDGLGEEQVESFESHGATLVVSRSAGQTPTVHRGENGWVVIQGLMFAVDPADPRIAPEALLDRLSVEGASALRGYEGTFVLAAWDERTRTAWIANDPPSCLNCYHAEQGGGLCAGTSALALARGTGAGLDPHGVQQLFARGTVLAPTTLFDGLRKLDLGEHVRFRNGHAEIGRHWTAYKTRQEHRSVAGAADALSALAVDRIRRLASLRSPVVADLTGGYDSRLVASLSHSAGVIGAITVNGPDDDDDVRIAREVARVMGWTTEHFDPATLWTRPVTPEMRRTLVHRTNGELAFTETYHHLLSRPVLAERYGLHFTGGGGELLRFFPWSQEFWGIGRRRTAHVGNALRYRLLQEGPPPAGLFRHDWYPRLSDRLGHRLRTIFLEEPGSLTTQQLDAAYLWRMTGFAPYTSAVFSSLPSVAPLMSAGVLDAAMAVPWSMRLTAKMMRTMIDRAAPRAAGVATHYGGTGGPARLGTLHMEARQLARQSWHLLTKFDRVLTRGRLTRGIAPRRVARPRKPYLTEEFRSFLNPATMLSRGMYDPQGLARLLDGPVERWYAREALILRVGTVEHLCRELGFEPGADFLA